MLNWLQHACTTSTDWTMGLAAPFSSFFLCLAIPWPTWFSVTQIPYLDYLEASFLLDHAHLAAATLAVVGYGCGCCTPYLAVFWTDGIGIAPITRRLPLAAVSVFADTAVILEFPARFETSYCVAGTVVSEMVRLDLATHCATAGYLRPSAWLTLAPVQSTVKIDLATT